MTIEKIRLAFDVMGYVSSVIVLVTVAVGVYAWLKGILPVLLRLGMGLAKRKIAIFAKGDNLRSLKGLLLDSALFRSKNIIEISSINDFGRAEDSTVFLVFWDDWRKNIDKLLGEKKDGTALIVYAPQELGAIPATSMRKIGEKRNTIVTNFRGRLLNDIVISMITTSYD